MDPAQVMAVNAETLDLNPAEAANLGQQAGADYVVFGSLTVILDNLSTDIRLVEVKTGKSPVNFSRTGDKLGEVINHVDLFAAQVNETLFGEKRATAAAPPSSAPQPGAAVEEPRQQTTEVIKPIPGPTGVIVTPAEQGTLGAAESIWRSKRFNVELVGLDVGDVDGDGALEMVFISTQKVFVFRLTAEGRFRTLAEIERKGFNQQIHVDVADINGNGTAEIFVSNINSKSGPPSSMVLEWNGSEFAPIAEKEPWYYRVIKTGGPPGLYAQGRTIDEVFLPGIFEMQWIGGRYEPGQKLPLPSTTNIYAFAHGDAMNNGLKTFVAFKNDNRLAVFDENGRELWQGDQNFGGNGTYFEYVPSYMTGDREVKTPEHYYLPCPVTIADLNRDGLNEIITVKNEEGLYGAFARLKTYKNGVITSLAWDGGGLQKQWQTREFTKFITDCVVADTNNDGAAEIAFTVVSQTGHTFQTAQSYLTSIDIQRELAAMSPAK
jgi:hypothetical protein